MSENRPVLKKYILFLGQKNPYPKIKKQNKKPAKYNRMKRHHHIYKNSQAAQWEIAPLEITAGTLKEGTYNLTRPAFTIRWLGQDQGNRNQRETLGSELWSLTSRDNIIWL